MRGWLMRLRDLVRLLITGHAGRVWRVVSHRLYSNCSSIGLRRDLTVPFPAPAAKLPIVVRPLISGDDLTFLDLTAPGLSDDQMFERLGQRRILRSGLETCYVAVTPDGGPYFMEWLVLASANDRVRGFFGNLYPRLRADEALLEGAYTVEAVRGQGIMASAMTQMAARAAEAGVRWVITFVDETYPPAMKASVRAGFQPYVRRVETYRLLRRRVAFIALDRIAS